MLFLRLKISVNLANSYCFFLFLAQPAGTSAAVSLFILFTIENLNYAEELVSQDSIILHIFA